MSEWHCTVTFSYVAGSDEVHGGVTAVDHLAHGMLRSHDGAMDNAAGGGMYACSIIRVLHNMEVLVYDDEKQAVLVRYPDAKLQGKRCRAGRCHQPCDKHLRSFTTDRGICPNI